ncbi:unnamed protein product [Bursaphelenchus xylophilus]|uniref:(pine wood nematode) hypothetical protein n=1 Tax=Bursaphelenchus xylophilus TaxID=6326 RepID=A0A1I7SCC2_BURXY|nr:srh-74 [Bursaphelenchus xylophilus]CAD5214200.1 unnamed protein product [Bursaphelenchus xylophilus]CAG9094378.1 unnamed protein product [Bursaphelenchus xylophilus]
MEIEDCPTKFLQYYSYFLDVNFVITLLLYPLVVFAVVRKTPVEVRFEKDLLMVSATFALLMNVVLFFAQPTYYSFYYGGYSLGPIQGHREFTQFATSQIPVLFTYFCLSFSIGFSYQSHKIRVYIGEQQQNFFTFLERGNNWLIFTFLLYLLCAATNTTLVYLLYYFYSVDPATSPDLMRVYQMHPDAQFVDMSSATSSKALFCGFLFMGLAAILHALKCNLQILRTIKSTQSIVSQKTFRLQWSFYRHYAVESVIAMLLMHLPIVLFSLNFSGLLHLVCGCEIGLAAMSLHSNLVMCGSLVCVTPYRRWILSMVGIRETSRIDATSRASGIEAQLCLPFQTIHSHAEPGTPKGHKSKRKAGESAANEETGREEWERTSVKSDGLLWRSASTPQLNEGEGSLDLFAWSGLENGDLIWSCL